MGHNDQGHNEMENVSLVISAHTHPLRQRVVPGIARNHPMLTTFPVCASISCAPGRLGLCPYCSLQVMEVWDSMTFCLLTLNVELVLPVVEGGMIKRCTRW